jgi:hypothetical protein
LEVIVPTREDQAFQQQLQGIEALIHKIETFADPEAQASARAAIQAIMDLHGAGLERVMELLAQAGAPGEQIIDSLARDDLVGSLLLLYGLHPLELETRVLQALEKVRPYLQSHGGNVELLGVAEGVDDPQARDRGGHLRGGAGCGGDRGRGGRPIPCRFHVELHSARAGFRRKAADAV